MRPPSKSVSGRIRVWLIANRQLVVDSLSFLLKAHKQFGLVGSSGFDSDPSQLEKASSADIVVIYLESGESADLIKDLHIKFPIARIIAVTDGNDLDSSVRALKFGAVGIVQAMQGSTSLLAAIEKAFNGETWLNQELLTNLLEKGSRPKTRNGGFGPANDPLTLRELEVIAMIGKGLKSKIIAEQLSISEATVRHHLSSIYGKLGVDDRLNLMIYAIEKGLVRL